MPGVSDHSPVVINTEVTRNHLPKTFRLYNVLLHQKEFTDNVHEVWDQKIQGYAMYSLWLKLQRLKDKTQQMNKEMTSMEKKLGNLRMQLQNTQGKLDEDPLNPQLIAKKELLM